MLAAGSAPRAVGLDQGLYDDRGWRLTRGGDDRNRAGGTRAPVGGISLTFRGRAPPARGNPGVVPDARRWRLYPSRPDWRYRRLWRIPPGRLVAIARRRPQDGKAGVEGNGGAITVNL